MFYRWLSEFARQHCWQAAAALGATILVLLFLNLGHANAGRGGVQD